MSDAEDLVASAVRAFSASDWDASGLAFDSPMWMICTVRGGKLVRGEYFQDEAAARAAVES